MDLKTELHERKLDEYAMAHVTHSEGPWKFYVDVIENRLNTLKLSHATTESASHSTDFPFDHLALRLSVADKVATVDCELRHRRTLE